VLSECQWHLNAYSDSGNAVTAAIDTNATATSFCSNDTASREYARSGDAAATTGCRVATETEHAASGACRGLITGDRDRTCQSITHRQGHGIA
jgi:hypothetical protein